ncbi:MAG: DUF2336 domain-containing protein [Caulobacterales bacterium]
MTSETDPLLLLARSRDPGDRERLLAQLIGLCEAGARDNSLAPAAVRQVEAVFLTLIGEAERDIRARLAERLARAEWAPAKLIETLANDDIEVARPIIAASPVLMDEALIRLITQASLAHGIEVAQRPRISQAVVEQILSQSEPAVLTALAANVTAEISPRGVARLVEASRTVVALRAPLVRHPRMTADLAEALYLWVGQTLRAAIVDRFEVDAAMLDAAIAASIQDTRTPDADADMAREESEKRIIDKLAAAGQLKTSYLLRALRDHDLGLFEAALAKLGDFKREDVRRASAGDRPELLALACAAVGIDRSAFPTVLELVRQANNGQPGGGPEGARRALSAFGPFAPDIAAMAFRQAIAAV